MQFKLPDVRVVAVVVVHALEIPTPAAELVVFLDTVASVANAYKMAAIYHRAAHTVVFGMALNVCTHEKVFCPNLTVGLRLFRI